MFWCPRYYFIFELLSVWEPDHIITIHENVAALVPIQVEAKLFGNPFLNLFADAIKSATVLENSVIHFF